MKRKLLIMWVLGFALLLSITFVIPSESGNDQIIRNIELWSRKYWDKISGPWSELVNGLRIISGF